MIAESAPGGADPARSSTERDVLSRLLRERRSDRLEELACELGDVLDPLVAILREAAEDHVVEPAGGIEGSRALGGVGRAPEAIAMNVCVTCGKLYGARPVSIQ